MKFGGCLNPMHVNALFFHRNWHRWLLAGIVFCAVFLRYGGFDRQMEMHPDQPVIVEWMNRTATDGYLKNTVYPGGFFRLYNQFRRAVYPFIQLKQQWRYQLGEIDRVLPLRGINFTLGRHFNVWLASLTCLLVYLLAVTVSGSKWTGLFSALLFCFAPDHIDHAHYVETDIAMVFTLALALWLWARFAQQRTWWLFAAAALASGFAAGTKYILFCLVALGWIFSFYSAASPVPKYKWWRILLLLLCATAIFAMGFALACPEVMDWNSFRAGLRGQGARVYGEGITLMGQARSEPFIQLRSHWLWVRDSIEPLGWGSLLAAAMGLLIAGTPAYRRFWPVLIGFPLFYLYFLLFKAPWIRNQEIMNFLPPWAVLAGLAPYYLWRQPVARRLGRLVAVILLLAAALPVIHTGLLAASLYKWPDTRYLANRWLQRHLPRDSALGLERYTDPAHLNVGRTADFIYKVETAGPTLLKTRNFDGILRNPVSNGRGIRHPLTGQRYPKYQAAFEAFTNQATLLCRWGPLQSDTCKLPFLLPQLELWRLAAPTSSLALQLPLTQPGYISQCGRETFFRAGHELGSAELLLIDKYPRQCAFGGPEMLPRPVFALVNTLERPADLQLRGFGRRIHRQLAPYEAVVLPLKRPSWRPGFNVFELLTVATRPEPHIEYVPCLLRAAFDAPAAAAILQQTGHMRQALDLLITTSMTLPTEQMEQITALIYPLAVANSEWVLADQWARRAGELHARLQTALAMPPESISVNQINGSCYNQCARIRISPSDVIAQLVIQNDLAVSPEDFPALPPGVTMELPVRLARGIYTITMAGRPHLRPSQPGAAPGHFAVYDYRGRTIAQGPWKILPDDFSKMEFTMPVGRESAVWLHFVSTTPVMLEYRDLEIRWEIHDQIRALYNELTAARAAHNLHAGLADQALAIMANAAPPCWNELELQRLELAALTAARAAPERIGQAARNLLQKSPDYWPALQAVDPDAAQRLPANLVNPIRFSPFLDLVGLYKSVTNTPGAASVNQFALIFEAQDDDTPPLAVRIYRRKNRSWREGVFLPIGPGNRRLQRGERVAVYLAPDAMGGTTFTPADTGVAVQANVRWSPGTLHPEGRHDAIISLLEIK